MAKQILETKECIVSENDAGVRLDRFLSDRFPEQSRSFFQNLIAKGNVTIEGLPCKKQERVKEGQMVTVRFPRLLSCQNLPENIPLDILYEDEDLLVVNKPKGMVVHPAPSHEEGTLVNALLYHCGDRLSGINGVMRPGIVHRIDKDTSGLLMVAKNDRAHRALAAQIQDHSFQRCYEAVVYGHLKEPAGIIDQPIGRSKWNRKKMCVTKTNSKRAVTRYQTIETFAKFSHLRLELETGRTHQIRVHMAYLGHPVAGDRVYGPQKCMQELQGQCLHAKSLGFVHPTTGKQMHFESDLPDYFKAFLEELKKGEIYEKGC